MGDPEFICGQVGLELPKISKGKVKPEVRHTGLGWKKCVNHHGVGYTWSLKEGGGHLRREYKMRRRGHVSRNSSR